MSASPICDTCYERPDGCWKNQEFGCQCNYNAAKANATFCPIGLWEPSRTIIGLFTAPKFFVRLAVCYSTWIKDAREARQRFVIVCTGTPARHEGERLWVDVPDSLAALPQQVREFCRWALTLNDWDYLFKCDDDTYVSIPRFMGYKPEGDYIGARCYWNGLEYAHGGAGYFLSRRAAEIVAEDLTWPDGAEDYLVGTVLLGAGIMVKIEPRLNGWAHDGRRPNRSNKMITTHSKQAHIFHTSHLDAGLHGLPPLPAEDAHQRARRLRNERKMVLARR